MIFLCFLFSSFVSFTQYSSLDRKRSLPRQRVFTYPPLKFVVETFLFPRPRVFSSRPIKSLIVTPLFEIALVGIRIGRILREKEDSHPLLGSVSRSLGCLDAPAVLPNRQLSHSRLMTRRIQIKSRLIFNSIFNSIITQGRGGVVRERVQCMRQINPRVGSTAGAGRRRSLTSLTRAPSGQVFYFPHGFLGHSLSGVKYELSRIVTFRHKTSTCTWQQSTARRVCILLIGITALFALWRGNN